MMALKMSLRMQIIMKLLQVNHKRRTYHERDSLEKVLDKSGI